MSGSTREARILASSASRSDGSGSGALVGSESGYSGSRSGRGLARACQAFFSSFSLFAGWLTKKLSTGGCQRRKLVPFDLRFEFGNLGVVLEISRVWL